ncbi:DNA-directed RNA polymerase subunit delta [Streptococcus moroccensis]|uniref:Probable DNA-directed RNA polymerase subunit delta n=1 Tax=Streptococcus moroccensis TaxID=1451356 RepID=A0ABT9YVG7_9STRE|nr:DNA-directed RNA polymerase subunit delta [Streptococcus moroccensis]MDQ0223597.1 DNA-directed RNA polymerase subunit delta [Streptococcus moroccensis]
MEFEVFAGQDKAELSMIEVARAILEARGRDNEMYFNDLVDEIQNYLGRSNSEIREALPNFYTDLNVDGSFIPLGENKWGLRSWYAIDEIDEEVITLEEDDEDGAPKRKKKRVNAFMDGDEDAIDYSDDDPEDEEDDDASSEYDEENPDDEKDEVESYDAELNEIITDDDIEEDVEITEEDDDDYTDEEVESED